MATPDLTPENSPDREPGPPRIRVLIVDDSALMRRLLSDLLSSSPEIEIVGTARDGREAVLQAARLKPDVITLDVEMPEVSGLEALRQIRAVDPEAKVVVVTALDQKQSLMDSIREGAIDFIVKPFERERVLALLAKLENAAVPKTSA